MTNKSATCTEAGLERAGQRETEIWSFLAKYAEKLRVGLIEGKRRWFEALLAMAPKIGVLVEGGFYRDLGWASYLDCMNRLGMGRGEAMTLLQLARAARTCRG